MKKIFQCLVFMMLLYMMANDAVYGYHTALAETKEEYGVFEGDFAFPFQLTDDQGKTVSLNDFRGKLVILNFFATWCEPCQEEMPLLVDLHEQLDPNKEVLLGINMTSQEMNVKDVQLFMKQFRAKFPVLYDKEGKVMKEYKIFGIPTTIVIDEQGKIMKRINGMLTQASVATLREHD